MDWIPNLDRETGALPERIISALKRDVASGALPAGTRLPPQRDLAYRVGVSLGVVSKAYAEAQKRGLVSGEVGRGTYVLAPPSPATNFTLTQPADGLIDFARNVPPLGPSAMRIGAALQALGARPDIGGLTDYPPPTGHLAHREVAARWIEQASGFAPDPARLALTTGAQHAIHLAIQALLSPGETLLCEAATFHGVRLAAAEMRLKLAGLPMDAEGVTPEGLDRAAASGVSRVVYLIPTLQNPTGRSMSVSRRREIAEIARKHDLMLIEDDIYAGYAGARAGDAPPPLATFCPERVFHISGAAKALSPGLRLGMLTAPNEVCTQAVMRAMRAQAYAPPVWGAAILAHWVDSGEAEAITDQIRAIAKRRTALALARLGNGAEAPSQPQSLHMWLPMAEIDAERTVARAARAGVELTPPSAPVVDANLISGLRLCLGQAPEEAFEKGLEAIVQSLPGAPDRSLDTLV